MYNSFLSKFMVPIFDYSMGTQVKKCLREFEESQWWPRDKILELQNQRLMSLVKYAFENTSYYRRIFTERGLTPNDITCSEDLKKLPVLTKQIVRDNLNSLISKNVSPEQIRKRQTSGSTGEPLTFFSEKNKGISWSYAASQRAYGWAGYQIGDKCLFIGQKPEYHSLTERVRETTKNYLERMRKFDVQSLSVNAIPSVVKVIKDFRPEFIRGYPAALYLIARYLEREDITDIRLKAIMTIAEKTDDYQRELFRKVFKCEVFSLYSAGEAPNIAAECSSHAGYHITAENVIVDIVDDCDIPVPAGKDGRILITNLRNYVMPFIRYDIGDVGAISDDVCSCGRNLPILKKLEGRTSDFIFTKKGRAIPGLALHQHFLARLEGVAQWQIVQESYDKVSVKLVLDGVYPKTHTDKITSEILSRYNPILANDMNVVVEFVESIPLTRTGKRRFIISKVTGSQTK